MISCTPKQVREFLIRTAGKWPFAPSQVASHLRREIITDEGPRTISYDEYRHAKSEMAVTHRTLYKFETKVPAFKDWLAGLGDTERPETTPPPTPQVKPPEIPVGAVVQFRALPGKPLPPNMRWWREGQEIEVLAYKETPKVPKGAVVWNRAISQAHLIPTYCLQIPEPEVDKVYLYRKYEYTKRDPTASGRKWYRCQIVGIEHGEPIVKTEKGNYYRRPLSEFAFRKAAGGDQ